MSCSLVDSELAISLHLLKLQDKENNENNVVIFLISRERGLLCKHGGNIVILPTLSAYFISD